ncbi:MAG: 5'-methylthioadenosine/S-adenosylhomocysteine nucleosidase [Thermomicrobiales bacterium]|nr:5'-methylthioadenosine/S-adenosylhomocysteine nucleosidase [Thermomicrobiales bacterium]
MMQLLAGVTPVAAGIVVAMYSEARHLLELADETTEICRESPYTVWRCRFGATDSLIVLSGIGMVQSAAATQWLISTWNPAIVGNFGCAGAHTSGLHAGDVVIGDRSVPHFNIQIQPDGSERYVGFTYESGADIAHADDQYGVPSDPDLVARAELAAQHSELPPWPSSGRSVSVVIGSVGSADVWTQHADRINAIHQQHGTLCEDMEAAAIAKICSLNRTPFITIKDISNNELHASSDLTDFSDFPVDEVGKRSATLMSRLLRDLGEPVGNHS